MKSAFVNHSLDYLIKNNACNDKQINTFRYTLEILYSFITKMGTVLLLSILLKTFPITFTILAIYTIFRGVAFGIHATKNIYCWIITLSVYSIGPLIIKYFTIPQVCNYICYSFGIISFLLWAPADTPARPLLNKKKRLANKIISLCVGVLFIIASFYINHENFYEILSFLFLLESICICPLTYKLFKVPYKNYENYKKS